LLGVRSGEQPVHCRERDHFLLVRADAQAGRVIVCEMMRMRVSEILTIINSCSAKAKMVPRTAGIERPLGCPPTRPRHALDR
jgi:hypothetical protein